MSVRIFKIFSSEILEDDIQVWVTKPRVYLKKNVKFLEITFGEFWFLAR